MSLNRRKARQPVVKKAPAQPNSPRMDRFEEYLEKYRRPIFSYVMRLVGNSATAEDIAQETFVRLFIKLKDIRDDTVSAWLYRVARNLVTDFVRKKRPVTFTVLKGRAADGDEDSPALDFPSGDRGPDEEALRSELRQLIDQTIEAMSPKFREVITLVDIQRLTHEQASKVVGCSVKTISARLARAREFFAGRMARFVDIESDSSEARTGI